MMNLYNNRKLWLFLLCLMFLSKTSSGYVSFDDKISSGFSRYEASCTNTQNTDSAFCIGMVPDSLTRFMRFDHTDAEGNHYYIRLSMLHSRAERLNFYNHSRSFGLFIEDKHELENDSARFVITGSIKTEAEQAIADLYTIAVTAGAGNTEQTAGENARLRPDDIDPGATGPGSPRNVSLVCDGAQVACSENIYSFPSGTTGDAPEPVNGYPNYGCLGSYPGPAWFYMQIGVQGDIIIGIDQGINDVDFICWGPFTSLSEGCSTGLTGTCHGPGLPACCDNDQIPQCDGFYPRGNIVDCSYSPDPQEICHILNAQVGEFYILLITNFSGLAGTITFSQTDGDGRTNCDIVVFCSMVALTASTTSCNLSSNTYSLSGNMEFSNPPTSGSLRITDNTAVPPVFHDYYPPFISPLAYSLTNIPCDGLIHTVTATFTDSLACTITQHYQAPQDVCPVGTISGGGGICDDGVSHVNVYISLSGPGPYDFIYAINGSPQPPITGYTGPPTYVISATMPGTYTLVSLSNLACIGTGTVSGSAEVTLKPVPVPTITGDTLVCEGSPELTYTTESGKSNYQWVVSSGGTVTGGGQTDNNYVTVAWSTPGLKTVSVNYRESNGCFAAEPTVLFVQNKPFPVITNAGSIIICSGVNVNITPQTDFPGTTFTWTAIGSSAAVTGYSDGEGMTISDILLNTAALPGTVTYFVTPVNDGCVGDPANFVVTVNPRTTVLFTLCNDPVVPSNANPFRLKGGFPSGGAYSGTGVNSATGIFTPRVQEQGSKQSLIHIQMPLTAAQVQPRHSPL